MWALTSPVGLVCCSSKTEGQTFNQTTDVWVRAYGSAGSTGSLKRKSASLGKLGFSSLSVIGIILTQTTSPIDYPVEEPFTSYFYLCLNRKKWIACRMECSKRRPWRPRRQLTETQELWLWWQRLTAIATELSCSLFGAFHLLPFPFTLPLL